MDKNKEIIVGLDGFLSDLRGALGASLVGAVLFGSHARGKGNENSDIDLALVLADAGAEEGRTQVYRVFFTSKLNTGRVALSVETYLRLKEFIQAGDPFAWVVIGEGRILLDPFDLLAQLRNKCKTLEEKFETSSVAQYLRRKCSTHYDLAMQGFNQFLTNLQLSAMAGAQAAFVQERHNLLTKNDLAGLADWDLLKNTLIELNVSQEELEAVEQLVMAHKLVRQNSPEFVASALVNKIRIAGTLWQRLALKSESLLKNV